MLNILSHVSTDCYSKRAHSQHVIVDIREVALGENGHLEIVCAQQAVVWM
jgi:hypothetical protein